MKSFKAYIDYGIKGHEEYRYNLKADYPKLSIKKNINSFLKKVKADFPNAEFVDILIEVEPKYDKPTLLLVGQHVASNWGGECIGFKSYTNCVEFECVEHGDKFKTIVSYARIEDKYKYCLK